MGTVGHVEQGLADPRHTRTARLAAPMPPGIRAYFGHHRERRAATRGLSLLHDPARHEPLRPLAWDAGQARATIEPIVRDTAATRPRHGIALHAGTRRAHAPAGPEPRRRGRASADAPVPRRLRAGWNGRAPLPCTASPRPGSMPCSTGNRATPCGPHLPVGLPAGRGTLCDAGCFLRASARSLTAAGARPLMRQYRNARPTSPS